ncbi:putative kinetochore protein spc24 [Collariella sp. IMI 366227]|nr:putative kinetochore protein spc24 [Collariella sp. IMI 366227]
MLLEEDPSTLIRHTLSNFNIAPTNPPCPAFPTETSLRRLARTLNTLSSQHTELTSHHSSSEHASEIARLDTQKFRVAKAASDLEMEAERLQAQLGSCREVAGGLV